MLKILFPITIFLQLTCSNVWGWVYPEHRDITLLAIQKLSPEYRSLLDKLWIEARTGNEDRLTSAVIDATETNHPTQLDFASWPAISGDHSCSPRNMLDNVLYSDWILKVADVAAQLKTDIAKAKNRSELINALRDSDIRYQRIDPEYATRAGSNNVHFLLALPNVKTTAKEYIFACLSSGVELNALGAYVRFHYSALLKASRYANESLTSEEKSALILSALADEAFALHFLEDVFASGHTAGIWGDVSIRKGTHDYYNEHGLEVVTWDGQRLVLMGDAHMRPIDAEVAADPVKVSIEQLLDAANGKSKYDYSSDSFSSENKPDDYNVCKNKFSSSINVDGKIIEQFAEVLMKTPVPGLATGLGELPRFRSEIGLFVGVGVGLRTNGLSGGFGFEQTTPGASGGMDINVRIGLGIEGVLNEAGDGLVFLDFGWRQDAPSTQKYGDSPELREAGQIVSAIPGRDAINLRVRMPFYLVPFDLVLTAPVLLWTSPDLFTSMIVNAVNGGIIPWQSGIATPIGRFQFILGREVGVSLYGQGDNKDAILVPQTGSTNLLTLKSVQLDIPVLEYRPFRTFSLDQSSSLVLQFNFGVDIPYSQKIVTPQTAEVPKLKPIWYIGLRTAFDWRYYY